VLTAGHCISTGCDSNGKNCGQVQKSDVTVYLGDHDQSTVEQQEVKKGVSEIKRHPDYALILGKDTTQYDVALLKLKTEIDFTTHPHIRPICLPDDLRAWYNGYTATLSGWGHKNNNNDFPDELKEIDAKVISNSECVDRIGNCAGNDWLQCFWSGIPENMLCVDYVGGKSCRGDSGGPLVTKGFHDDGKTPGRNYELIGVVRAGPAVCNKTSWGTHTRVTSVLGWIKNTTANAKTCPRY